MIEWLLRKLRRTPSPRPPADLQEAEHELSLAQEELKKSEGQAHDAHAVAKKLQKVNKENHFAERALIALRGIIHE